jgi:hypothetical protein
VEGLARRMGQDTARLSPKQLDQLWQKAKRG